MFVGNTFLAARLIRRNLHLTMSGLSLVMALLGAVLLAVGRNPWLAGAVIVAWGVCTGITTVGWSTWLTRVVPHLAENGGGVLVAAIQVAIMLGAAAGGVAIDRVGPRGPIVVSIATLAVASVHCWFVLREHNQPV